MIPRWRVAHHTGEKSLPSTLRVITPHKSLFPYSGGGTQQVWGIWRKSYKGAFLAASLHLAAAVLRFMGILPAFS